MNSTESPDKRPCALEELERLWSDLEDHERFNFQSFCEFYAASWKQHSKKWAKPDREYFLDSFETFLSEKVGDADCRPFHGLGRSKLVDHDPKADALRVGHLLPKGLMTAYCQRFAGSWTPGSQAQGK